MLAYLDTLIGFAVVMLGFALLITIVNQIIATLLAHRGSNLLWGLGVLFRQINPAPAGLPIITAHAELLADTALTHPLVSDSIFSTACAATARRFPRLLRIVRRWQLANAIRPEELAAVLNHIASNRPETMHPGLHATLAAEIHSLLSMPNPMTARQGNLATPAAAHLPSELVRKAVDIAEAPAGNLEAWFGAVMDRVSQRFTTWMRVWTVAFSFTLAIGLCLDVRALLSYIYANDAYRAQLGSLAPDLLRTAEQNQPAPSKPANDDQKSTMELEAKVKQAEELTTVLAKANFPVFGWDKWKAGDPFEHVPGVLASALLLSLGAPFCYNALSTLTNLRPQLSAKQQSQDQSKKAS
jgi:hypothetical protein